MPKHTQLSGAPLSVLTALAARRLLSASLEPVSRHTATNDVHQAAELARANKVQEPSSPLRVQWGTDLAGSCEKHQSQEPRPQVPQSQEPLSQPLSQEPSKLSSSTPLSPLKDGSRPIITRRTGDADCAEKVSLLSIMEILVEVKQGMAFVNQRLSAVEWRLSADNLEPRISANNPFESKEAMPIIPSIVTSCTAGTACSSVSSDSAH